MNRTGLVLLGAVPGAAAAYLLLSGYILNKVRPVPITAFASPPPSAPPQVPPMYRRRPERQPQAPPASVGV